MFFLPSVGFVVSCAGLVTYPVTIDILLNALRHFNLSCMLYVCTHAAFLVAFFSFLRISNLVPYSLDDLLSTTIIFFGARMFPSHPLAQFCKFTEAELFSFVGSFLRFLYHLFLTRFCAPLLHCLVIYTPCQRLCLLFRKVPGFGPTLAAHFTRFLKACVVSVGLNPGFFLFREFSYYFWYQLCRFYWAD